MANRAKSAAFWDEGVLPISIRSAKATGTKNQSYRLYSWRKQFLLASLAASYQTQRRGSDEDRSPKRNFSYIPRAHHLTCHAHFNITLLAHQCDPRAGPSQAIDCRWKGDPPGSWQESLSYSIPENTKNRTKPFRKVSLAIQWVTI